MWKGFLPLVKWICFVNIKKAESIYQAKPDSHKNQADF